eukprot:4751699-Ditylum_brightwellii.AAC.1
MAGDKTAVDSGNFIIAGPVGQTGTMLVQIAKIQCKGTFPMPPLPTCRVAALMDYTYHPNTKQINTTAIPDTGCNHHTGNMQTP